MDKKMYVISLSNGFSYDDQDIKPVAVAQTKKQAEKWINDNTPVTEDMYKSVFHYTYMDGLSNSEFSIDEVKKI